MTQVTADLEFFKCDVCGTYLHRDIFCDHRRECKGPGSQELTRKQADTIDRVLDKQLSATRRSGPQQPLGLFEQRQQAKVRRELASSLAAQEAQRIAEDLRSNNGDAALHDILSWSK